MKEGEEVKASDPRLIKLPTTDCAVIAGSIATTPGVIGAVVVILYADGGIGHSVAGPTDEETSRPLIDVHDVVKRHLDAVRGESYTSHGLPDEPN